MTGKEEGLLLHPSLSLEEHLSKFPLCKDCQFSYSPSFVCNMREKCPTQRWFKIQEKAFAQVVSQIQAIDDWGGLISKKEVLALLEGSTSKESEEPDK